ncbi:extracellular solute-binding protein, family 3 [Alkaliphilus metalliredigens QYMF]|uniref:Extracellular solute-binding protein, family 3 n=1 Tax=Alkaliphilus metalliredigens (strain QYMF) TaxID=293826 RepID=A6TNT2_ALKMQ|nr:transporter substrate-binding domain-containing protein [Alkaliphilus metalliredigens]ABR47850.1 extracellular solute-binding protein, family 3 [Alkaliphilus metalliredigens QYMF]
MKKGFGKFIKIGIVALSLIILVTGCSQAPGASSEQSKLEAVQSSGKLVLGTSADYPPYEFYAEVDGALQVVGFDIEIAKEIAKDMGVELEIRDMDFDGLLSALVTGNIDMIIAGMVPSDERKKSVDFSVPYYSAEQTMVVRAADFDKFSTVEDFTGLTVGAQTATIQEEIAKEQIANAELRTLSVITDLVMDLKTNRIDGVVLVEPVAKAYAENNDDVVVSQLHFGQEDGVAVAVAKDTDDFLNSINTTLERLLAEDMISQFIVEATELASEQSE